MTREKIEKKIDDVIDNILNKEVNKITYLEYRILDCRSKDLLYQEKQKEDEKHKKEMSHLMAEAFTGFGGFSTPSFLPEPEIKED